MDTLLWLMLGAAVQCNQRVAIVEAIKTLPVEVQEAIAMKIKEVFNVKALVQACFHPEIVPIIYSLREIIYCR